MVEGFLIGEIREVVAELAIEGFGVSAGVRLDFFGNLLERLEMRCGIAVSESVIRDDIEALPQELLEFIVHQKLRLRRGLEFVEEFRGAGNDFNGAIGEGEEIFCRDRYPVVVESLRLKDGEIREA